VTTLPRQDVLPGADDVAAYRARGWYVSPPVLDDADLALALEGMREYHEGRRDRALSYEIKDFLDWRRGSPHQLRVNDFAALQSCKIAAVALKPVIGEIAARLIGTTQIRLFSSSMIYKPSGADPAQTRIGWHNDRAYWRMCSSADMLTAWIPLHDITLDCGPLTVLDGSNRWPDTAEVARLRAAKSFICDDHDALQRRVLGTGQRAEAVPLLLSRGQISFHSAATFHSSGPNTSGRPRMNLVVHLQDRSNRHVDALGPDGEPVVHSIDQLVRRDDHGAPDYTDPDICPVLWDAAEDRR
jgi:ectoine hydroxylase-related dioxygenase (phytanoyl-CoA dioxygenase family)